MLTGGYSYWLFHRKNNFWKVGYQNLVKWLAGFSEQKRLSFDHLLEYDLTINLDKSYSVCVHTHGVLRLLQRKDTLEMREK